MSQSQLAQAISYSPSLVAMVESGKRTPSHDFADRADECLGTGGLLGRILDRLLSKEITPEWFRPWIELEREATSLRSYHPGFIDGLLQTPDYVRALLSADASLSEEEIEQGTTARLERQTILTGDMPPMFIAVVDEAVLRRPVGGPKVMHAQCLHLIEASERPRTLIQVLPQATGMHPGLDGPFVIASSTGPDPVAYRRTRTARSAVRFTPVGLNPPLAIARPRESAVATDPSDGRRCGRMSRGPEPCHTEEVCDLETLERVRELRARGCTPKVIARTLGRPLAEVAPLVRAVAAEAATAPAEPELLDCWVSRGWSGELIIPERPDWSDAEAPEGTTGLAGVLVARRAPRRKASVCGYLVDTHCLGVKNALGPRVMDEGRLPEFARRYFDAFQAPPLRAPLELAQHLVLGAEQYARELGFKPHPDFEPARAHLGEWTGRARSRSAGRANHSTWTVQTTTRRPCCGRWTGPSEVATTTTWSACAER